VSLDSDQGVNHPVEIVEERQQVEGQLDPALSLAFVESVCIHDRGGIVQAGARHHRPVHVPVNVVGDQRSVEEDREPLPGYQEQQVEGDVQDVFWQDEWIERCALIDRILVVSFQLVKGDNVENCEEYQKGVYDEGNNVGERGEGERHPLSASMVSLKKFYQASSTR